jgi:hypothetical protein
MTKRRLLPLIGATAALNLVLLMAPAPKAYATDYMGTGKCQWCTSNGVLFRCCRLFTCGETGQPACDCHDETQC